MAVDEGRTFGYCAKSGKRVRLWRLVEDGYQQGLLVDPAWYDAEHPQEHLTPVHDQIAPQRPAPRTDSIPTTVQLPTYTMETGAVNASLQLNIYLNMPVVVADDGFLWQDSDGNQMVDSDGNFLVFN